MKIPTGELRLNIHVTASITLYYKHGVPEPRPRVVSIFFGSMCKKLNAAVPNLGHQLEAYKLLESASEWETIEFMQPSKESKQLPSKQSTRRLLLIFTLLAAFMIGWVGASTAVTR